MNAWRQELAEMLREIPGRRPATLRRSRKDGWLYCTDLPAAADDAASETFQRRAEAAGWTVEKEQGWMQLTRWIKEPPGNGFSGPFGPEAGCCLSLQRRHEEAAEDGQDGQTAMIRLVKAGEEGPEAYEAVCFMLHREWAERLRKKQPLPRIYEGFWTRCPDETVGRSSVSFSSVRK